MRLRRSCHSEYAARRTPPTFGSRSLRENALCLENVSRDVFPVLACQLANFSPALLHQIETPDDDVSALLEDLRRTQDDRTSGLEPPRF